MRINQLLRRNVHKLRKCETTFQQDCYIKPYQNKQLTYYQSFYSPTNAQVIVLKTILKFTLK